MSLTRTALLACVAFVTLLVVFLSGLFLGRASGAHRTGESSAPVVEAVRKVAKLATVQMEVADVVKYEDVRQIVVFDIPKNATLRVKGTVLGGFDLGRSFDVVAEPSKKTLRVFLPPPEVLSVDARVEWFDERSGWLNPITPEDRTRWTAWARASLARAAKDAGLYARATAHAKELLTDTSAAFGWTADVRVAVHPQPPSPLQ
ncbi:MAG TPA: DUF4230 domain-containing protein [Thermoanaerobaculia bacterium]|nr:DUF4230 domain-containing protein [Thermoanaerobaculia bacterium]